MLCGRHHAAMGQGTNSMTLRSKPFLDDLHLTIHLCARDHNGYSIVFTTLTIRVYSSPRLCLIIVLKHLYICFDVLISQGTKYAGIERYASLEQNQDKEPGWVLVKWCLTLSLPQAIIIGFSKQHRSRWDGSYEPPHLDLRCLIFSLSYVAYSVMLW